MSFGKNKSKQSSVQTSNSSTSLDPTIMGLLTGNYAHAQGVANTPYTPYSGDRVADANQNQQDAWGMMSGIAAGNTGQGLLNQAAAGAAAAGAYSPVTVRATGYNAQGYNPSTYAATNAGSRGYDAVTAERAAPVSATQAQGGIIASTPGAQASTADAARISATPLAQASLASGSQIATTPLASASTAGVTNINRGDIRNISDGSLDTSRITGLLNPYLDEVVGNTMSDLARARDIQRVQDAARQTQARAFGGTRGEVENAETNSAYFRNLGSTVGQLRYQGYDQALQAAQQEAARRAASEQSNQGVDLTVAGSNAGAANQAALTNAGLLTNVSQSNAGLEAQRAAQQAQMDQALSVNNSGLLTGVSQSNAAQQAALAQAQAQMEQQAGITNAGLLTNVSQSNAQQDAARAAQQAQLDQSLGITNAGAQNDMARFNAGQDQQVNLANAGAQTQAAQFGAGAENQASLVNAGAINDAARANAGAVNQAGEFGAAAQNQAAAQLAAQELSAGQSNQSAGLQGADLGLRGAGLLGQLSGQELNQAAQRAGLLDQAGQEQHAQQQAELDWAYQNGYLNPQQYQQAMQTLLNQSLSLLGNPTLAQSTSSGTSTGNSSGFNIAIPLPGVP